MNPLRPFTPDAQRPWDRARAAHLLRRAGFAPSEGEIRAAVEDGPQATVRRLLSATEETERFLEIDDLGGTLAERDNIDGLRAWWLGRLRHTQRPLLARMTLFWHNHFATSNAKVRDARLMLQQILTLERHALGNFGDILRAIARDPAMIVWLDGQQNVNGRPNENFARELFELFALGVGNYSERDIQEGARAFTGWHQKNRRFFFATTYHDGGPKTIFNETGPWDGDDCISLTLKQPACARFLAGKLLREFVCPEPPEALTESVAVRLRETDYDVSATLETLLSSEAMFDERCRRARIKSPVEFVVGAARSLELQAPGKGMANAVSEMGQRLFEPPSVKGWDGHRAWLNSATMLVRLNAAARAARPEIYSPAALCDRYEIGAAERPAFLLNLLLDGAAPTGMTDELAKCDGVDEPALRSLTRLLLSSPEYQMA